MLIQFLPLIIVVNSIKLSKKKLLLFLTFAMCLSTLYIVNDFDTGFYGATFDYQTKIVPRMRASAQMLAYEESYNLASIDFHAEYFLEFIFVHLLSKVAGLNYVLTYFFVFRILMIALWALLFVWSVKLLNSTQSRLVTIMLALSIILANQGYNYETSPAPLFLLLFYLVGAKQKQISFRFIFFFLALVILLASFRETILLGLLTFFMLCITLCFKLMNSVRPSSNILNKTMSLAIFISVLTRIFFFSSLEYLQGYVNRFIGLIDSVKNLLIEGLEFQEAPLTTLRNIQNPVDAAIGMLSFTFAISFLGMIAFLAIYYVSVKKDLNSSSLTFLIAYLFTLFIPVSAYVVGKIQGFTVIHDFSSATVLPMSLLPLVVLTLAPFFNEKAKKICLPAKNLFFFILLIYLSVSLVFAPFIFLRREIKSIYDVYRVSGDLVEYTILGNNMYKFVVSYVPSTSQIVILNPPTSFLQHYYLLPLQYEFNMQIETRYENLTLASSIYDNSIYAVLTSADVLFLNEVERSIY